MEHTDLVCGKHIPEEAPRYTTEYDNKSYAFCSPECKRQFDDHPDRFIQQHAKQQLGLN